MGFEKFGKVSFASQTKVARFVDELEKGILSATKCNGCGTTYFPPRADCHKCLSSDMEWVPVEGTGRLVSYTTAMYAPVGFEDDLPYTLAMANFGGIKVFGRLSKEIDPKEIEVGMEVRPKAVTLSNGQISYEFVKA